MATRTPPGDPARTAQEPPRNPHGAGRLNWLRASVMGANDGIVSTALMVVGVAGASADESTRLGAGVAAVVAGALSMAVGEYVSVSTQRDSERAVLRQEKEELAREPEAELLELAELIEREGVDHELAAQVAAQLSERDALRAHARLELGLDPSDLSNPFQAGLASMLAFLVGGVVPLAVLFLAPARYEVPSIMVAVGIALTITGTVSAHLGRAPKRPAVLRAVIGGSLAMAISYGLGALVGAQI